MSHTLSNCRSHFFVREKWSEALDKYMVPRSCADFTTKHFLLKTFALSSVVGLTLTTLVTGVLAIWCTECSMLFLLWMDILYLVVWILLLIAIYSRTGAYGAVTWLNFASVATTSVMIWIAHGTSWMHMCPVTVVLAITALTMDWLGTIVSVALCLILWFPPSTLGVTPVMRQQVQTLLPGPTVLCLAFSIWYFVFVLLLVRAVHRGLCTQGDIVHNRLQLLSRTAHDLRSPLNGVLLSLQLLNETMSPDSRRLCKEYLRNIEVCGIQLMEVINDTLALSKMDKPTQLEETAVTLETDIVKLVLECVEPISRKNNVRLTYAIEDNVPKIIIVDYKRLRQVLINLLTNSLKFTNKGGEVLLEVKTSTLNSVASKTSKGTSSKLKAKLENPNCIFLQFAVCDTGCGFEQSELQKLFASSEQLHNAPHLLQGTGLGLMISHALVDQLGGKLAVSSPGKGLGARFYFTLPCIVTQESQIDTRNTYDLHLPKPILTKEGPVTELPAPTYLSNGIDAGTVLLVDDNDVSRGALKRILQQLNFKVKTATNGKKALSKLQRGTFPYKEGKVLCRYDLCIMDIEMPGWDGFRTMEEIEKRGLHFIPFIAASGSSIEHFQQSESGGALPGKFDEFISKPIIAKTLLDKITRSLEKFSSTQNPGFGPSIVLHAKPIRETKPEITPTRE